jgi:hypothetical protein
LQGVLNDNATNKEPTSVLKGKEEWHEATSAVETECAKEQNELAMAQLLRFELCTT